MVWNAFIPNIKKHGMKYYLLIFSLVIFFSCRLSQKKTLTYYYIEPFKEQEIKFQFISDSTFVLQDLTGCNQFILTGKYKRVNNNSGSYIILDSVIEKAVLKNSNSNLFFSISNGDTAKFINNERLFINQRPFIYTAKTSLNLQNIRYKKLEEYYIGLLGEKEFIRIFGNGVSKKEAKRLVLECKLPDIILKADSNFEDR